MRLAGTRGIAEFQEAGGLALVTDKRPPRQITEWPPDESLFIDFLNSVYSGHASGLSLRDIYRVNEISTQSGIAIRRTKKSVRSAS